MHRLLNMLLLMVCLLVMLACGLDTDDRMVRRYAGCMTDTNTTLHRMTVSNALGTVPLRAYPNNPAALRAMRAQAKCRKAI